MSEGVELISSGYAWQCPECMRTEYESAVPAGHMVRCSRCGASFAVTGVSHRVEPTLLDSGDPAFEAQGAGAQPSTDRPVPGAQRSAIALPHEA